MATRKPPKLTYNPPKCFAVGSKVRVRNPGIDGVVMQIDDERTSMSEYWHTVSTKFGEKREPGCNLELIPEPLGGPRNRTGKLAENIHFHGPNARINIDSVDRSTNSVTVQQEQLFIDLRENAATITDESSRDTILVHIHEMEKARHTGGFVRAYHNFMSVASDHITVFAALLPALTKFLSDS
jgi:hypothetical protein